jgi:hypothetical protein
VLLHEHDDVLDRGSGLIALPTCCVSRRNQGSRDRQERGKDGWHSSHGRTL